MSFNFDEVINRRSTNSLKWDVAKNELPLWVADMDFRVAPCITDALKKRVDEGIFGYAYLQDTWKDAVVSWWKTRHNCDLHANRLLFALGAIPALATAIRAFTNPGDRVLLLSPVYNAFFAVIRNNGRIVEESPLVYKNSHYSIDFDDLERRMSMPETVMLVLLNPHNPTGNIFTKEELSKIAAMAQKYSVMVISDEIHCDLVDPGLSYTPYISIGEDSVHNSLSLMSATKAFNVAGIQTSIVYTQDTGVFNAMKRALNNDEDGEVNVFSALVTEAAFSNGAEWLDEVREYIYANKEYVRKFVKKNIPHVRVIHEGASYLLWIDISEYLTPTLPSSEEWVKSLRRSEGLVVSPGTAFGKDTGRNFFRLNVACPRLTLSDAMLRLKKFTDKIILK